MLWDGSRCVHARKRETRTNPYLCSNWWSHLIYFKIFKGIAIQKGRLWSIDSQTKHSCQLHIVAAFSLQLCGTDLGDIYIYIYIYICMSDMTNIYIYTYHMLSVFQRGIDMKINCQFCSAWIGAKRFSEMMKSGVASGKLRVCYGKWTFIVDFPIKSGDFP